MQSLGQEEYISGTPCTIYRACSFFFTPSVGIVRPCNASRFSLSKRSFLKRRRKSKPAMRGYAAAAARYVGGIKAKLSAWNCNVRPAV